MHSSPMIYDRRSGRTSWIEAAEMIFITQGDGMETTTKSVELL